MRYLTTRHPISKYSSRGIFLPFFGVFIGIVALGVILFISSAQLPQSTTKQSREVSSKNIASSKNTPMVPVMETSVTPQEPPSMPEGTLTDGTDTSLSGTPLPRTETPVAKPVRAVPTLTNSLVGTKTIDITPYPPQKQHVDIPALNLRVRAGVINILCSTATGGTFRPVTGSGVVISDSGIVLTNAHLGQYILLSEEENKWGLTCIARAGSPAVPIGTFQTIFLSPEWIQKHANEIKKEKQLGTGEHDYAFLRLIPNQTKQATAILPLSADSGAISTGTNVLLAGYSAGFLGGIAIVRDLYLSSAISQVGNLYTFDGEYLDLFSVGSPVLAQQGSSGGAVVDITKGTLKGIIVTTSLEDTTAERELNALALTHIHRALLRETGDSLATFLATDPLILRERFVANYRDTLWQTLTTALGE